MPLQTLSLVDCPLVVNSGLSTRRVIPNTCFTRNNICEYNAIKMRWEQEGERGGGRTGEGRRVRCMDRRRKRKRKIGEGVTETERDIG